MQAIYKREVSSYFNSMIGWVFVAALTVFIGIYFMAFNLFAGKPYFSTALSGTLFIFMVVVPILTMRSLAEERHSKTDQLLLTSPASVPQIVLGKYFALLTVFLVPVLISCFCPIIIKMNGTAYLKADYATIFAFFLLGAVELAIGLLISATTESQIIAAVGTFGLLLLLYLWDGLLGYLPKTAVGSLVGLFAVLLIVCFLFQRLSGNWEIALTIGGFGLAVLVGFYLRDSSKYEGLLAKILGKFSLLGAFNSFANDHVFDISGLLLYLSLIFLLLFLTIQVIQKRRWN